MRRRRRTGDAAWAEGLAAGTGLLSGETARRAVPRPVQRSCVRCNAAATIELLDLVDQRTTWHCPECDHRWNESTVAR